MTDRSKTAWIFRYGVIDYVQPIGDDPGWVSNPHVHQGRGPECLRSAGITRKDGCQNESRCVHQARRMFLCAQGRTDFARRRFHRGKQLAASSQKHVDAMRHICVETAPNAVFFYYTEIRDSTDDGGVAFCYADANKVSRREKWLPT